MDREKVLFLHVGGGSYKKGKDSLDQGCQTHFHPV